MTRARAVRLVAAVVLTAATGAVLPAPLASAAACPSADGVTVVVDFHELGGGVHQVCDAGGAGDTAARQFTDAGFVLERVQRQPGFVCRVDGAPTEEQESCVNTPPADAYWGLWWSDGKSGSWSYASVGVDSLKVPAGGYVALSWNGSTAKSPPGSRPTPHPAEPSASASPSGTHPPPTTGPTTGTTTGPAAGSTGGSRTPLPTSRSTTASATASPSTSGKHVRRHPVSATSSASATPLGGSKAPETSVSPAAAPVPDPSDPSGGGLPGWVAPAAIGLLFAAAAGTAVVRRRRGSPSP